jgi:hypothetical protein
MISFYLNGKEARAIVRDSIDKIQEVKIELGKFMSTEKEWYHIYKINSNFYAVRTDR